MLGQLDAAIEELRRALRAEPDSEDAYLAHFKLEYIYEQRGAWPDAIREYERTLQMNPDFDTAREQIEGLRARSGGSGWEKRGLGVGVGGFARQGRGGCEWRLDRWSAESVKLIELGRRCDTLVCHAVVRRGEARAV